MLGGLAVIELRAWGSFGLPPLEKVATALLSPSFHFLCSYYRPLCLLFYERAIIYSALERSQLLLLFYSGATLPWLRRGDVDFSLGTLKQRA
jgi:hypothetical protein